ncbi:MAG: pseudomurein-binding repeat-containing protein, partial [Methanobacterium sp.]
MSSKQVSMPDFLRLMAACTVQINSGSTAPITLKDIKSAPAPSESVNSGNIHKNEYVDMAGRIKTYSDSNNFAPNYVRTSLGNI